MVEFVQLTTECCWGQPSDPCQRGCLTSHACVMWGPRTLNADDDDDDKESIILASSGRPFHATMDDGKNEYLNLLVRQKGI